MTGAALAVLGLLSSAQARSPPASRLKQIPSPRPPATWRSRLSATRRSCCASAARWSMSTPSTNWPITGSSQRPTCILLTHEHRDHLSPGALKKVRTEKTRRGAH